jgi:hypothetical protein
MKFLRNVAQGFEAGRSVRTGNAVVPFDNRRGEAGNNNRSVATRFHEAMQQRPIEPYWPPRNHHKIYGPSVRIEVEETRYGKKTTYFFEDGYFDESWEE